MPDPVAKAFNCLMEHVQLLHKRINELSSQEEQDQARFEELTCRLNNIVRETIENAAKENPSPPGAREATSK